MLHEIGRELGAALVTYASFPLAAFPVVDGPEPTTPVASTRERIVLEYDDAGDSFGPVRSQRQEPKQVMVRNIAGKITIYARSPSPGATQWEHRQRAEHVLDLVLVAMHRVAQARCNTWTPKSGKFVLPADTKASESINGAVYELLFTFDRAVQVQKWDGSTRPTHELTGVTNTDQITDPSHATPETAC